MWRYNRNKSKWERQLDNFLPSDFNFFKQELEKTRYYSKCLSGSSYTRFNEFENIYDIFLYKDDSNWIITSQSSVYGSSSATQSITIKPSNIVDYTDYAIEYGYTQKNLFTPQRLINDLNKNYYYVDVATTTDIDLSLVTPNYIIDNTRLLTGHRVLVKDQITFVTLANTIDPNTVFTNNYYVSTRDVTTITYYFYNNFNGIYEYRNNTLNRLTDLDDYQNALKYSIVVKLGSNREKEFHLSRLKNGHFPLSSLSDNIEFLEHHSWILRNKVEYQNIFELSYFDILHSPTFSYGTNSTIPSRDIFIGEFGMILNYQDGYLNIIENKFKEELRGISRTSNKYWICGADGTLLKIDKLTLELEKIDLNTRNKLMSIDFINDLRGIVVGQFNTIYYTLDGGFTWINLLVEAYDEFDYNKILFVDLFTAYVGGSNGFFATLTLNAGSWTITKLNPTKFIDEDTSFGLADNINDFIKISSLPWTLTYSAPTTQSISSSKEVLVVVGDSGLLFTHNLNNFSSQYNQIFLESTNNVGNIQAIVKNNNDFIIAADNIFNFNINSFSVVSTVSNVISNNTQTYLSNKFNALGLDSNNILIAGSDSNVNISTTTGSYTNLSDSFNTFYKSKLLFLDYDVASKVNFFDSDHNYRLPLSQSHNLTSGIFNARRLQKLTVNPLPGQKNWLTYYKDSLKQFQYNSPSFLDSNKVEFSSTFNIGGVSSVVISATNGQVTNELVPIINLAPTLNGYAPGATGITGSTFSSYNLFLYDNLMILHVTNSLTYSIGDVFYLDSQPVTDRFILNHSEQFGLDLYLYFYSDFNGNIINNLVNTTYSITFSNVNRFSNEITFSDNFNNKHLINWGYEISAASVATVFPLQSNLYIDIDTKYNNHTAYYNMQSQIEITDRTSFFPVITISTYSLAYPNSLYLNFGYTPRYNVLDYLSNIDSTIFTASKTFDSMPSYVGIPVGGSNIYANITGNINGYYKVSFNPNLVFEWTTIYKNTFIDLNITDGITTVSTSRLLVTNKYLDSATGFYIIEFNKQIDIGSLTSFTSIDILSRNTLQQISDDLQELNNIHLQQRLKEYGLNSYTTLENEIKNRFWTDSYAKVMLSDKDIKQKVTGIIYYDYKNELSLNVINTESKITNNVIRTYISGGNLALEFDSKHKLTSTNQFLLQFTGTNSNTSGINNPQYDGIRTVLSIIDDYNIVINQAPSTVYNSDPGYIQYFLNDPYFNYEPIDILDIGIDFKSKQSIMVSPENVLLDGVTQSLVNVDFTKYRFKMVDGLNLQILLEKFSWIFEAEIENAVIGQDKNGLVWYTGIWLCGRWFGGTWYSGEWRSGTWYDGVWNSVKVDIFGLNAKVNINIQNNTYSKWYGGKWYAGTWNSGLWFDGSHYDGIWNTGEWFGGTWFDGIWNAGLFKGGTWVDGKWYSGEFSCDADKSFWLDGEWNGGDFACGVWYNGTFDQRNGQVSRFGTRATNERKAIWYGGNWINGQFHSQLHILNGVVEPSIYQGYSIWYSGIWNNGTWWGGTCYQIDWKLGTWYTGVLYDISVIAIDNTNSNIQLDGQYYFNRGDKIWIIDDNNSSPYNYIGELSNPLSYIINDVTIDTVNNTTTVYITLPGGGSTTAVTGNKVVSYFKKANWYNGIWFDGIFDGDSFHGGIWFNGIFKSGNWLV